MGLSGGISRMATGEGDVTCGCGGVEFERDLRVAAVTTACGGDGMFVRAAAFSSEDESSEMSLESEGSSGMRSLLPQILIRGWKCLRNM